jgi:hypothetical protein
MTDTCNCNCGNGIAMDCEIDNEYFCECTVCTNQTKIFKTMEEAHLEWNIINI